MKKFNRGLVLSLVLIMTTPVMADTVVATKVEQAQEVTEQGEEVTAGEVVEAIEERVALKTFQVKPLIIEGKSYIAVKDLEEHLGAECECYPQFEDSVSVKIPGFKIYFGNTSDSVRVNYQYRADKINKSIVVDGVYYVPAVFTMSNMNGSVSYDKETQLLTVNYYGIPKFEKVDTKMNIIKGYVVDHEGNPLVGATITITTFTKDGKLDCSNNISGRYYKGLPDPVVTDENGYYEFAPMDTEEYPLLSVNTRYEREENGEITKYSCGIGSGFDETTGDLYEGFTRHDSKLVEMPMMYSRVNLWD